MTTAMRKPSYRPRMLGNGPSLGIVGPIAALWPWVLRIGLPFIGGASTFALFASAAKKDETPGIPFNWENVGISTLLGGIGTAGFYVTGVLPEGARPVGYAASIVSVAAAVYFMFKPSTKAPPLPTRGTLPPRTVEFPVPNLPLGILAENLTLFPDSEDVQRSIYLNQTYRLTVQNNTPNVMEFFVGLRVDREDGTIEFRSPEVDPKYGRQHAKIPPMAGGVPGEKQIDVMQPAPAFRDFWGAGESVVGNRAVSFELFRQLNLPQPFMTSMAFPVFYWATG